MPPRGPELIEESIADFERLRSRRSTFDAHFRETAEVVHPHADDFLGSPRNTFGGGEKRTHRMYDSTACLALKKFGAIMLSLFAPPSERWHALRTTDEELNKVPAVKEWFEQVVKLLFAMRSSPRAHYYEQAQELFESEGAFGNGCLFVDGDDDPRDAPRDADRQRRREGIRYKHLHIGQTYIATGHSGQVDAMYRVMRMTARAAKQRWQARAGLRVNNARDPFQEFEFLHVVAPRPDVDPERFDSQGMPWRSLYISLSDRELVEDESGYHEFPYMFPRWSVTPGEDYGRGPAMLVLPNVKVLQVQKRTLLRSWHNAVEPMILLPEDGIYGAGGKNPRFMPGAPIFGGVTDQGTPRVHAYQNGTEPQLLEESMNQEREVINDAFFVTLFKILVDEPKATATEVLERAQEKGQLIGPAGGRMQSELFGPQIERELGLLQRQGLLPPYPPEMLEAGGEYKIEYLSPASRLQRSQEISGIPRMIEILLPLSAADPLALSILDPEETGRHVAEVLGVPTKLLRSPKAMYALRQQSAQQQQAAQQLAAIEQGAGAAKDGASALAAVGGLQQNAAA